MYKIGDFSKITGISVKTLRYYDEINLFKPSYQDYFTGYRYYEDNQIDEIQKIKKLREINLSLNEIKDYLETGDINIILKKEEEFRMKVEAIKNYVNEITYEIKEGNYDDYIKWNGLRCKNIPIALEIRDNVCKYYMVFKNGEYYSEFVIFTDEDNLINLNVFEVGSYLDCLLNYLKKDYDYLVFRADENMYDSLDIIREKCDCISETKEEIEAWNGNVYVLTSIKVSLK